jgi:hypothetical protein
MMAQINRWLPSGLILLVAVAMLLHGPIHQFVDYHEFADGRALPGVPNAGDVLSNIGFALAGLWGFWALRDQHRHSLPESSWPGYRLFLAAVVLTALGSGFYHLAPDNGRLLWDRLPIALACAGLLAGAHAETHESPQPRWVPALLAAIAVLSVLWWSITEHFGADDLRPYVLLQGAPLVLIPLWQAIHGSPRADRLAFGAAILLYVLAKVAELNDRAIFDALGFASGHTIKHLLAAAASFVLTANLVRQARARQAGQKPFR